jgi:two-component system nitrogen regulation response regulator NtrX
MTVLDQLRGECPGIVAVRDAVSRLLERFSGSRRLPPILIKGETGTGKGLLARAIHDAGPRAAGPFVDVNCAAIPETLLEAEMFGVTRGAFTDAHETRPGLFRTAHRGSLFLDEIGLVPPGLQAKLLTAIEEQNIRRLGDTRSEPVDVWIIAATNADLAVETRAGRFREDLYHRLSVVPIRVPPLADRREDIPDLVNYFMEQISQSTGLPQRTIGADAMAVLQSHDWPGNVRQLRNNVERLMILAGGDPNAVIDASMLPQDVGSMVPSMPGGDGGEHLMGLPLREAREVFEREYLVAQINRFGGNISRTAEFVGMERSALHRKLKALGVG